MKAKCKQCNKTHRRVKLDLMTATKWPNQFCSDNCEEVFNFVNRVGTKLMGKLAVKKGSDFRPGQTIKADGHLLCVESVKNNVLEVSRHDGMV